MWLPGAEQSPRPGFTSASTRAEPLDSRNQDLFRRILTPLALT
jgi:hypothetical protein